MNKILAISFILGSIIVSSCVEKGPQGKVYVQEKSTDDVVTEVLDAQEGNGWTYEYNVELHKNSGGDWLNAGRFGIYRNLSDNDECNLWVEFDGPAYRMPVYLTDDHGYRFKVQWQGEYYYF